MAAHEIIPNRSVLLQINGRIRPTRSGHKILKMKRDGLILEFFDLLEKAKKMRFNVASDYEDALKAITIARAVEGEVAVLSATYALKPFPEVTVSSKSIMGTVVPRVEAQHLHQIMTERGYGVISTSAYIEDSAVAFEKLLDRIVSAAEIETTMKIILDEIEKTKRRVNALEFRIIPELEEAEKFIELRLEEMERENVIRLKHLKDR